MTPGPGLLSGELFSERMLNLPPNTLLKVVDPVAGKIVKLQVVTAEEIFPWLEFGSEWRRNGDAWPAVRLVADDKQWAPGDVLFLVMEGVQFVFNQRRAMGMEGFEPYAVAANQFGHSNPHAANLDFDGKKFAVKKIGRWDVEARVPGKGHIPSGGVAPWLLAVSADNKALLAEDFRHGGADDTIWVGYEISLDRIVDEVLTPTGE